MDFSIVVMPDSSIMLMGGWDDTAKNDVWRSTDYGATWTQVNASAGWAPRNWHCSAAMPDGSIVLTGGAGTFGEMNGAWRLITAGSSAQNPSHTYTKPGTYQVALQVFNADGYTSVRKVGYITVTEPSQINADFTTNTSSGTAPLAVLFTDTSTGRTPTMWNWSFGDGNWYNTTLVSERNPTHVYTTDGIFTVYLIVSNASDSSTSAGKTIVIILPPFLIASFSTNTSSGTAPLAVAFTDTTVGGTPTMWNWSFGDGSWFNTTIAANRNVTHIYTASGTPISRLTVTNANGADTTNPGTMITVTIPASKIGVFRNSTHLFYLDYNGNGVWNGALTDKSYNFGISGDKPITGDWNSDGITEIGVFRPSTHLFYLDYNGNGVWNGAVIDKSYNFGITGDTPISGDWNLDGRTEIGVFRNSTHLFYLDYNGNGVWNGATIDKSYNFGITGDIPITGDWNNDRKTDIGVFRTSTHLFYLDYNGNGAWNGASIDKSYSFGITGDIPITGDWNNDGKTEIGVFRNSTHLFYLDLNGNGVWNGASVDRQYNFGITGDKPLAGKW